MPSTIPTSPSSATTESSSVSSASPEPLGSRRRGRSLVAVGGGTGLSALLRGLKTHVGGDRLSHLTGVVTVTDDGGSSGRLRREFGVLPPGDIRNCIVALADDEALLARLFQYRFPNGEGLLGHSFGNLFLTALTGITGDFHQAILTAESILSVRGKIFPATLVDVRLRGRGVSGTIYEGESAVGLSGEQLAAVELDPAAAPAFPPAVSALESADLVLLGPGSLYTSILPNLLIPGIRQALRKTQAKVILLLNLMTQPGETDRMMGSDHLLALQKHVGKSLIDAVLVNSQPIPRSLLEHYLETGSEPVAVQKESLEAAGVRVLEADLLAEGDFIRHDSVRLASAVLDLMESPGDGAVG
jgi:uncharacterized cofD-like protein